MQARNESPVFAPQRCFESPNLTILVEQADIGRNSFSGPYPEFRTRMSDQLFTRIPQYMDALIIYF